MAQTPNLDLTKPALSDAFRLDDWNGNMQKIDDWAGTINAAIAALQQRMDAAEPQNGGDSDA